MKVYVAGLGIVSSLGIGVSKNFGALMNRTHGITGWSEDFDPLLVGFPVADCKLSNKELAKLSGLSTQKPRTALLSVIAAKEAIQHSKIDICRYKTGFISATTVGGMDLTEKFYTSYAKNKTKGKLHQIIYNNTGKVTELAADVLGINTYVSTINTACSSSINSMILAARLIKENRLDIAIAGGADALTAFTLNGFNSLLLLDNDLCLPFDAHRKGINLGEGAGYVLLVSEKVIHETKCDRIAALSGYANSCDAFHQTALSSSGDGPFMCMSGALKMAKLSSNDINYINLHGTATPNNDASEATAISRLFDQKIPLLSSTKSFTGHTLGASGGVEAIFSILALMNNRVPPNLRFSEPMPETPLLPVTEPTKAEINHVLSNSFGFGGNCSSILFSKVTQ